MRKSKLITMIMMVATILMMMGNVFAYEMPENVKPGLLISPNPNAIKNEETIPVDDTIKVQLNGENIDFTDANGNIVNPQIINSRTMVPMRKIFEVFGADIIWDGETQRITAITPEKTLNLQIGNAEASITSGDEVLETIILDSVPVVVDGRTLVPVRFIAESLELNVGWDATERTVVIIDTDFIFERIQKEAPTFYEYMTTRYETPNTFKSDMELTGTINYVDAEDRNNNTNLKLILDGVAKKSEELLGIDLDMRITGKGSLLDTIKENDFEKITMNILMNSDLTKMYIKSSLLESEIGKKWALVDMTESVNGMSTLINQGMSVEDALKLTFNQMELNAETYNGINEVLDIVCPLISDEYFTVTGRTTKVYTYEIDIEDVLDMLDLQMDEEAKEEALAQIKENINLSVKSTVKVTDNVATEELTNISAKIKLEKETIEVEIKATEKLVSTNQKVIINMPDEDEIFVIEDEYSEIYEIEE